MPIINDRANKCVVDTETGEYMTWALADWQSQSKYYILHDGGGKPILGSVVSVSGRGDDPVDAFVKYSLDQAWVPSGKAQPPTYFFGPNPLIEKLARFLEVYRHYSGVKDPDPRFEFVDNRGIEGEGK